ncbi:MAG TPA: type II toxin-antitoxin system prevent-host-death family antitoxin [Solirubrobacterales bacterium]|jgi:prevent-host-death family protein|nr:type II toxin-antitoxin system prevent-host-death family antitoxin [Solirubrobacterales bacterium]
MARIGMHEAKTQLSKLVERVEAGEEIVITRRGQPAARLVPERNGEGFASLAGAWRGRVQIAADFDELPADIAESLGMQP